MSAVSFLACLATFSVLIPATFCLRYLFEGVACKLMNGNDGICGTYSDCGSAFSFPENLPVLCSTRGLCCPPEYIGKTVIPPPLTSLLPPPPPPPSKEYKDTESCSLLVNRDRKQIEESSSRKACRMYAETYDYFSSTFHILGGHVVEDMRNFPYMVALGYSVTELRNGRKVTEIQYHCGGMLISDRFVLTAAHCESWQGPVEVKMGGTNKTGTDSNTKIFGVEMFIAHPCYVWSESYYDIALVKLNETITVTDYIFPACLSMDPEPEFNRDYDILGWGATNIAGNRLSESLLTTTVSILPPDTCSLSWQPDEETMLPRGFAENVMICAKTPDKGGAPCRGDSGGPLSLRNSTAHFTVVGVISQSGTGCGDEDRPGILTKIYPFLLWIEDVIWPDGKIAPLIWDEGSDDYDVGSGDDCGDGSQLPC